MLLLNVVPHQTTCCYKNAAWGGLVAMLFFVGMLLLGLFGVWQCVAYQSYWWLIPIGLYLLFAYFLCTLFWSQLCAVFSPANWLLRLNHEGVWLKYRSYLHQELPADDAIILQLSWSEIAQIELQNEVHVRHSDASDSTRIAQWFLHIKLNLPHQQLQQVREALQFEQQRKPAYAGIAELKHELFLARKHNKDAAEIERLKQALKAEQAKYPGKHRTGRFLHRPVVWSEPDTLRIDWTGITPGRKHLQRQLQQYRSVKQAPSQTYDYQQNMSQAEFERLLHQLIEQQQIIPAIELIRHQRGCSLLEAKQMVEGIQRGRAQ